MESGGNRHTGGRSLLWTLFRGLLLGGCALVLLGIGLRHEEAASGIVSASSETVRIDLDRVAADQHLGRSSYVFLDDGAYDRTSGEALWRLDDAKQAGLPRFFRSRMTLDGEHAILFGPDVVDPRDPDRLCVYVVNAWGIRLAPIGEDLPVHAVTMDISHGCRLLRFRIGRRVIGRFDLEAGRPLFPTPRGGWETISVAQRRRSWILIAWCALGATALGLVLGRRDLPTTLASVGALLVCCWLGISESGLFPRL